MWHWIARCILSGILVAAATHSGAAPIVIDNGLAPPSPANVINSLTPDAVFVQDSLLGAPTTVELSPGGQIGDVAWERFEVFGSSEILMTGGFVYDDIFAHGSSTVTMRGGVVGSCVCAFDSAAITISGGAVLGAGLNAFDSSTLITVIGHSFAVGGNPVPLGLINATNGQLTGFYLSGEAFTVSFYHNGYDDQHYAGRIVLTPEPANVCLLGLALVGVAAGRRFMAAR